MQASLSEIQLAWHSRQVSLMLFLQMAQFSTATFQLHSATAFHCLTSMRLSISIAITQYKNLNCRASLIEQSIIFFKKKVLNGQWPQLKFFILILPYKNMAQTFSKIVLNPPASNYQSLEASALESSASKKRLFVRKPGPSTLTLQTEKQRKASSPGFYHQEQPRQGQTCEKLHQNKFRQEAKTLRAHRHTQNFKKECMVPSPFAAVRQAQSSPREPKLDLLAGLKYIQRAAEGEKTQNGPSKTKYPIMLTSQFQSQRNFSLDDTTDNSLKSECSKNLEQFKRVENKDSRSFFQVNQKSNRFAYGKDCSDYAMTSEEESCLYCSKTKKNNQILQEKCLKLQTQLYNKQHNIKLLTEKLANFAHQNQSLGNQQAKLRQANYVREMQIYQQCSVRYEAMRKQLSRVAQRIKYLQIQNGVLARYKQDCNQARKDFEKIKLQNDNLKRQISSICRMGQKYNNGKKPSAQPHKQRQYHIAKAPHLKIHKEEDTMSLQLSEMSYQHL